MHVIDLRSDTVTQPSAAMRAQMAAAPVGDDVFGDDPSVNALENRVARLAGKETALLLPSGTQSNLVALLAHCQRGDEYIVGQDYHTYLYEAGGGAVLGSIQPQPIAVEADGSLSLEVVKSRIKPDDSHFARSKLLVLENTHNGKVLSLDYMEQASRFARSHGLFLHLDGARVFNAAIALGVDVSEITRHVNSVSICCSKGLGAPVGSLLCGSAELIASARRWRKMVGGGLRQSGILAAAIDYALDTNVQRLQEDHANAKCLAESLATIDGVEVLSNETNMVFIGLPSRELGEQLAASLAERGIKVIGGQRMRLVTHLDLNEEEIQRAVESIRRFFGSQKKV
ncbi:MAG: low-specificity L-threonine aldolase [Gammaproteobacteria bacterium]|nr:low-specificity L-threonine aldolase [Gammaproteobacteria bacterium]